MPSNFNIKKRLFFISLFILPAMFSIAFYWFVIRKPIVTNNAALYKALAYFGPKTLINQKDTQYYTVADFQLKKLNGSIFDSRELEGKIYTINFIDINNTKESIAKAAELLRVQKKLAFLKIVKHLSVIVNDNASPQACEDYLLKVHNNDEYWIITKSINSTKFRQEFFLANYVDSLKQQAANRISPFTLLIDTEKKIRGIYNGTGAAENNRMMDEIRVLTAATRINEKAKLK